MEAVSSSASSANPNHLPLSQLPTFVTQHNTVHSSKQVPTSAIDQQGENIQHVTSSGGSVMVIQQPQQPGAPSIGLVASAVSSAQSATSVAGQVSSEHPQIGGLYTTATGIPGEYVMPGTNMIQSGAQGFHVHVPVVPQQEGSSEDGSNYHEMDEEGRGDKDELREQDRFLPIANVARIMKKGIPKQGKIAKDAKECVQECVSEFISFITSEASERCQQEKRKTINGEDILFAMSTLGFDNYVDPLKQYLTKYREAIKGEKGSLNASSENMRSDVEHALEENSENNTQSIQFQVAGNAGIHPSMVAEPQTSTIYTYPAQLQTPTLHFQ